MTTRPKIVLLGMLTKMPVGGVAWLVGQYAVGFRRLGFDVYYVEAHARTPSMFVLDENDDGSQRAADYLGQLLPRFGLAGKWAFHALHADGRCFGMSASELNRLYHDAALILNMHGGTVPLDEHTATGRLAMLGTDPVELELELERGDARAVEFVEAHSSWFTWGLNYGNPDCLLPWQGRYPFVPSPPPVVLDFWPDGHPAPGAPFTTIGNWRQHWRQLTYRGEVYGWSKHQEFLKILDLPGRVDARFQLALSSFEPADQHLLEDHGWSVRPGLAVSSGIDSYRRFISESAGELTVAKDQNVRFRSGWFSERSATYLAAGRPVIMQDTGFGNFLPTGEGLLPFADLEGAIDAVDTVASAPQRHRRAARAVAREFFSHEVVLRSLLEHAGVDVARRTGRPSHPALPAHRRPAAAALPSSLALTPVSRRPLELPPITESVVRQRPIPASTAQPEDELPTASIVVPVLDNLAVTRMALESVIANTDGPAYELIVIDNGSDHETRQYLEVLATRHRQVRLVRNETNRGFAAGTNQGLCLATGKVVVVLNNDTIVTPGWLRGLCRHLADPKVGLVGPVTNRCGNQAEVSSRYDTYGEMLAFAARRRRASAGSLPFDIPVAMLFCAAFRRHLLATIGLLDERFETGMFEDDDFSRRVRAAGLHVVCAPDVFIHHFGEASLGALSASGDYGRVFHANRLRYEDKWSEQWSPHERRPDPEYQAMVERVREAVEQWVPASSVTLVASKGADELVALPGREGWHFPRLDDGTYAGHYPADDAEAIRELEALRQRGARYFVVPETSRWWLDHYRGFARHLEQHYRREFSAPGTGIIFTLGERLAS